MRSPALRLADAAAVGVSRVRHLGILHGYLLHFALLKYNSSSEKKRKCALLSRARTRVEFATHLSLRPRESDLMRGIDGEEEDDVYDADANSLEAERTESSMLAGFHARTDSLGLEA